VFSNFNLQNQSAEAERIGREQFGALCRAIGKAKVSDANELIGGQFEARVKVRPASGQYSAQNEIDPATCKQLEGSKPAPAAQKSPAQASGGGKAPPWADKSRAA
jgi:hypothetical protein